MQILMHTTKDIGSFEASDDTRSARNTRKSKKAENTVNPSKVPTHKANAAPKIMVALIRSQDKLNLEEQPHLRRLLFALRLDFRQ